MKIGANYQIPFRNVRWVQYYGADFQYGSVKGTGDGTLSDAVKDQPWMGLTLSPGLIYRSTAVSELGFMIPLAYRKVSWELDPAASLEISDKNFSAGLGAIFINRFSRRSSLLLSLTHQQMWTATVWGIGFQYDFK